MSRFPDYDDREVVRSGNGRGETFGDIMSRRISRRAFLQGTAAASAVAVAAAVVPEAAHAAPVARPNLSFEAIQPQPNTDDKIVVPATYTHAVLLRWGDPITADAPDFDAANQTAAAQEKQFGYNCDFVGFLPLPVGSTTANKGLLAVNHEYTNTDLMFRDYDPNNVTKDQVDVELAAHGLSVVEVERDTSNQWMYNRGSEFNRRYTATSPMTISGPAVDHEWLKTSADATGKDIRGTLNNCAGGKTPWGTVVTAEENFHQYFANVGQMDASDERKALHERYGLPEEASSRKWENFYDRFDASKEPNEPFRFGWAVEYDPYDPQMMPVKRTSIGRYRHEAQTFIVAPDGKVAVYSGDDARFEYVYKFVTEGTYNASDRAANMSLLDTGTLYVAKFNDDGSGEWMPLVFGEGPLTEANGFTSQADVLLKTRLAGDALGATKMDRPEDIEPNPVNKKVYIVLTNNTRRGTEGNEGTDAANPRDENKFGHIIELTETNDDHTATTFNWEILLLCGDPSDESTFFAGFPKEQVSPISNPDNVTFDNAGNLWIATDGQPGTLEFNDALFAVPVEGEQRGFVQQFFSSVAGSEVCGPEFNPDNTALFLAIQHPGDGGTWDEPLSTWPDGNTPPRPSVVVVQANNNGPIGLQATDGATGDQASPGALPQTGGMLDPTPWVAAAGLAAALGGAFLRRRGAQQADAGADATDAVAAAPDTEK